jgi:uncharacterized protein
MPLAVLKKSAEFILKTPGFKKRVIFVGGEPTMNPELIIQGVSYLRDLNKKYQKKLEIIVDTNGTLFNKKIDELYQKVDYISVSLDGLAQTHDKNRKTIGGGETFKKTLGRIAMIRKKYPRKLIVNKVISSNNYQNILKDILFIYSLAPRIILWSVAFEDIGWSSAKIKKLGKEMEKLKKWARRAAAKNKKIKIIFPRIFFKDKKGCALENLTVSPDGGIYSCEILADKRRDLLGNLMNGNWRPDLVDCRFSLKKNRCRNLLCRDCHQPCLGRSFTVGQRKKRQLLRQACYVGIAQNTFFQ